MYRIVDNARFAPNGGNRLGEHVIVLKDVETRRKLVPLVRECTDIYMAQVGAKFTDRSWSYVPGGPGGVAS